MGKSTLTFPNIQQHLIQDIYWAILLCLSMFGFFGLGAFPIILELAVITMFTISVFTTMIMIVIRKYKCEG